MGLFPPGTSPHMDLEKDTMRGGIHTHLTTHDDGEDDDEVRMMELLGSRVISLGTLGHRESWRSW